MPKRRSPPQQAAAPAALAPAHPPGGKQQHIAAVVCVPVAGTRAAYTGIKQLPKGLLCHIGRVKQSEITDDFGSAGVTHFCRCCLCLLFF
jgi:hypothetical protein